MKHLIRPNPTHPIMKKNKVHAINNIENAINTGAKSRLKNMGEWLVALSGFPLAYVMLPVSCCVRNPAAMVLYDDNNIKDRPEPICENIGVGLFGMMGCICCCGCCLGECGQYGPKEF